MSANIQSAADVSTTISSSWKWGARELQTGASRPMTLPLMGPTLYSLTSPENVPARRCYNHSVIYHSKQVIFSSSLEWTRIS